MDEMVRAEKPLDRPFNELSLEEMRAHLNTPISKPLETVIDLYNWYVQDESCIADISIQRFKSFFSKQRKEIREKAEEVCQMVLNHPNLKP
jgi:hypothetical protein